MSAYFRLRVLFLSLLLCGCRSIEGPTPELTLPGECEENCAHYKLRAPGEDYAQKGLLGQVFFSFDGVAVTGENRDTLEAIAVDLRERPEKSLLLVGYSDWQGTEEYNRNLSRKRAESVAEFLQTLGIAKNRLQIEARGSSESSMGLAKDQTRFDRRVDVFSRQMD